MATGLHHTVVLRAYIQPILGPLGLPGGSDDPVVVDFATSRIAGGGVYAARLAGAQTARRIPY